jgi:hypothetical protein
MAVAKLHIFQVLDELDASALSADEIALQTKVRNNLLLNHK